MNNLQFPSTVNLSFKKENNANVYTSKLLYNTKILQLYLRTYNTWTDYYLSQRIQLLATLIKGQFFKPTWQTKYQYFTTSQLDFQKDFTIEQKYSPLDRDLFDTHRVERLDKPVFLNMSDYIGMFRTFLIFNLTFSTKKSPTHADYRLLNIITHGGEVKFISITKLFSRWSDMFHLLVNIFLYRTNVLAFGSVIFKEELVAINWTLSSFKFKFFKHATPYFFSKDSNYGSQHSSTFFSLIHDLGYKILFLTNIRDLEKTVHFLRSTGFYMIAPVPYNMSPWSVTFPVPVFVNNLFTQLFFLKFLTFAQQRAYSIRYQLYIKSWLM